MEIELKCFATLRAYCQPKANVQIAEATNVRDLLSELQVPLEEVKLIFINGRRKELDTVLKQGDSIGIFPPVGGG